MAFRVLLPYLSEPSVEKLSSEEENDYVSVGSSSMQGWRAYQENAHNCFLNFDGQSSFFAVYDGHNGPEVAKYCSDNFPDFFKAVDAFKTKDFKKALKDAFIEFDATLLQADALEILQQMAKDRADKLEVDADPRMKFVVKNELNVDAQEDEGEGEAEAKEGSAEESKEDVRARICAFKDLVHIPPGRGSGTTAVVAFLTGRDLYVANVGDSRCIVCRNGRAIEMSFAHIPEDEDEAFRITSAGGHIDLEERINGDISVSRSIGDHEYKMNVNLSAENQILTAIPYIKKLTISPKDEFMVLACTGIWNFMSSDEVVQFVKPRIDAGVLKMSEICEKLIDNCLAPDTDNDGAGCDNFTAIIVKFNKEILELQTCRKTPLKRKISARKGKRQNARNQKKQKM